ncbi:MAG: HAMP domain-containing protein, partial [Crocinitomicaceae bacterium]
MIRFNSFTFQIWLPFAFALLIIISIAALYYPSKQEAYYIQNKKAQTLELSKTVAMNYELVFTLADSDPNIVFSSLKTILDFAQKDHDIAFISIFDDDEYFSHRPNNIAVNEIIKWDSIKYIYQTSSFSYLDELGDKRSGFVKIAVSRSSIQDEISKNNRPIYFLLLGLTIFFLIAFYVLARWISKPIISVTNATLALSNQDFTGELPESNSKDEIGLLVNAIRGLRVKLLDQKSIDAQVVDKLETLVEERTLDLQQTQSEFVLAQKNAKFGIIRYYFNNDAWKSSDEFDLILGVDESVIKNMDGLS